MGFCSPQLVFKQKLTNDSHAHTAQHTALWGAVRIPRPASCGSLAGARGFRLGEAVASRRLASAPASAPALSCRAAQRLVPPPALPSVRAWRRRRALRSPASPPQPEGGREEAGRRARAGEEAGLRRAVAGAERGGRAAGTRLAWLAASARTSAPQPRVSLALGFDSAASDLEEPAGTLDHWYVGRGPPLLLQPFVLQRWRW